MDDQLLVLTPEKTVVSFKVAGIGSRLAAHLIDGVILYAGLNIIYLLGTLFMMGTGETELSLGFLGFATIATVFLYFILQEWLWSGLTLGKKSVGIRVLSVDGTPITMRSALYRNLLRPGDFLPAFYFAGFVAMFTNERSQRLGDLAAGTIVIHEAKPNPQYQVTPHHAGIHPLEDTIGNLSTMTMEEYFAIKRLADRFPELPPTVQARSVEAIWVPFAQKEKIESLPNVHPVYQMEAVVMKFGRDKRLF